MTNQEFISYAKFKVQQWLWRNADDMDVYDKLENKCFKVAD